MNDTLRGGDIYLVREGVEPKLIVGRGDGMTTNVCPAFSPDGSRLLYSERIGSTRALVILTVAADGSTTELTRIPIPGGGFVPCALWSSDGTRVAYLQGEAVVVRGLDGSTQPRADGDPGWPELTANRSDEAPLLSPGGDWRVEPVGLDGCCDVVVARPDGSDRQVIARPFSFYAIPTWSPDGRKLLYLEDVSGLHFTLHAASLDAPLNPETLASNVRVNGSSSWPGRGDVSWQPVHGKECPMPNAVASPEPARAMPSPVLSQGFARPFEYSVPPGSELSATMASTQVYALTEGSSTTYPGFGYEPVSDVRGITVAFATRATTHGQGGRATHSLRPERFFDDLHGNPALSVGAVTYTHVGRVWAVQADTEATDSQDAAYPDIHLAPLEGEEVGLLALAFPSRLIVAVVDGGFLIVHVWAADAEELAAWLPEALRVIDSIHFIEGR